jgi:hypothetical protein
VKKTGFNVAVKCQSVAKEGRMCTGPGDSIRSRGDRSLGISAQREHLAAIGCGLTRATGNFRAVASFATQMKAEQGSEGLLELNAFDRQVIRVDMPPAHAGITAALRRAFEAAATEPSDVDFNEFLRKLN